VALVLGLTVAGFIVAHLLTKRDAQRDSERRVEVAAAQIRGRVEQAASLTESLRRFMLDASGTGLTSVEFATNALRWLSPADFPAAAWVERVPDAGRAAYERRIGQPIVTPGQLQRVMPTGSRSSYLPATLVSGVHPMDVPGIDLSGEPGIAATLARATRLDGVAATPLAPGGLFLVAPASNLVDAVLHPGYVVVFISDATLRAAATDAPTVQVAAAGTSKDRAKTARTTFTAAGRRYDVLVPRAAVQGTAVVLPWSILAAGLVLAGLAAALGINAARRARTQEEVDRIFTLSTDLIAIADFNGYFTRVNPAAERILGYTAQELTARPYLDFVHPEDRARTAVEVVALRLGRSTLGFENRYVRKDGSSRLLEWTVTPVPDEGLMCCVGRDVTERRQAEAEVARLVDVQTALRRVATLVAREAPPAEVFAKVVQEVASVLGDADCSLFRDEGDGTATVVAVCGAVLEAGVRVGTRIPTDGTGVIASVLRERRPCRMDDSSVRTGTLVERGRELGIRSAVGYPIVVRGRVWGALGAGRHEPKAFAPETETRLDRFAELAATAVANAEARAEVQRLAEEQAALRRVATLVARGVQPAELFSAVTQEVARLFADVEPSLVPSIVRFDPGPEFVLVGAAKPMYGLPLGSRWGLKDLYVSTRVLRTGSSARVDETDVATLGGPDAELLRRQRFVYQVGSPIVVEGRLWGAMTMNSTHPLPRDTDERLASFTELVATAIANADSRDQLTASRARLVTAGDEARRRVVRDLHDGAQQRLVHTIVTLKLAERAFRERDGRAQSLVGEALQHAQQGNTELRELAHGILPGALTRGGLGAGVDSLVARLDLPVRIDVPADRLTAELEASAYFIVAEALTNVVKHAQAASALVSATLENGMLRVEVRDDGVGGADRDGEGLVGIADRVTALGGRLEIDSPPGGGTRIAATLPLAAGRGPAGLRPASPARRW
jgi:PAS domain S-box-containing protein